MSTEQNEPAFRLNALVTWHASADGERLQVRMPDGDHLTFEQDVPVVERALESLSSTGRAEQGPISEALIALLAERRVITRDAQVPVDWMVDAFDYMLGLAERKPSMRSPVAATRDRPIAIIGRGWLADVARDAARLAGLPLADEAEATLWIAACDLIDYVGFSRINGRAVAAGRPVIFLWREVARIVAGPLVLPGETACFECYRTRVRAAVDFAAEFEARAQWTPDPLGIAGSELAAGAVRTFLARHLLLASAGAYDVVEPATLYGFDLLSMELSRQPVPRVARCRGCDARAEAPRQAVRALA